MYLIIQSRATGRDTRYDRLEALSFAPETDPTLASLPVGECQADVVTEDELSVGDKISLYDDMDGQWFYQYWVTRAQRLSGRVVRIVAQSALALLDKVVLPPMMSDFKKVTSHITDVLVAAGHAATEGDANVLDPIDILFNFNDSSNYKGFFPEQTARERLQMICQARALAVRQCGISGEYHLEITYAVDTLSVGSVTTSLIPYAQTFWKPEIEIARSVKTFQYSIYDDFTQSHREGERWEKFVVQEGYTDSDTGITVDEEIWYGYRTDYEEVSPHEDVTDVVAVDGNTFARYRVHSVLLANAYFKRYDVRLDAINNGQYWPGDRVQFYLDEKTICAGTVKSCDFTFGQQARAKMVICTDLEPIERISHVTFRFEYQGRGLGRLEFYVPGGNTYVRFRFPEFNVHVPGGVLTFVRPVGTSVNGGAWATDAEVEKTYEYRLKTS